MNIDKQHPAPMYQQLKETLKNEIWNGIFYPHQQLPSERTLCRKHDLSRMTVHRAMQSLIVEGWAYSRQGKGTFVNVIPDYAREVRPIDENNSGVPLVKEIINRLKETIATYDTMQTNSIINDAFCAYSTDIVSLDIFPMVLREIDEMVTKKEVPAAVEHFGSTLIRSKLLALLNASPMKKTGIDVLAGCAAEDFHEIGLLILTLNLRRRGYGVVYLGQAVPPESFFESMEKIKPKMICISAALPETARNLRQFADHLNSMQRNEVVFAFGGPAFSRELNLEKAIAGQFLGKTLHHGLQTVCSLLPYPQLPAKSKEVN